MSLLNFSPSGNAFNAETHLHASREAVRAEPQMQSRIKSKISARITVSDVIALASAEVTPPVSVKETIWQRIRNAVEPIGATTLLHKIRGLLLPSEELRAMLFQPIRMRLVPASVPIGNRGFKWVAAFALVLVTVRISPLLFLAPYSAAESPLILLPTRGEVSVFIGGLWQSLDSELIFTQSALVQTRDGEATIVLHDDGVIRLGPNTTVALHDTADRPAPAEHDPTLTLHAGKIWVQSLIPAHLQGITIATSQGIVEIHEGSISITEGAAVSVEVWDRKATVHYKDKDVPLVAGERTSLTSDAPLFVKNIAPVAYDESWAAENLRRDAVHRREIAQLQYERRIAVAGILPTSRLYPVKRAAEAVDMLLTFGEEAKAQKQIGLANTRLNEAAALIAEGSEATEPLAEYRRTLLAIATGSGEGSLIRVMLRQELSETAADITAALPDDDAYVLKKTVLETSAAVPGSFVDAKEVQGVLLVDTLSSLMRSVEEGNVDTAKTIFQELSPYLDSLDGSSPLSPEMQKEAKASLATFAVALNAYEDDVGGIDPEFLAQVSPYLPVITAPTAKPLSDAEIDAVVQMIYNRIFIYKQPRSRWNQLLVEFRALDGHPDQGRILRRLYRELPENGLARHVRTEFERVKEAHVNETSAMGEAPPL